MIRRTTFLLLVMMLAVAGVKADPPSVDNGLVVRGQAASLAESGPEDAVPIGGLWQEFKFFAAGSWADGCDMGCASSPAGNSEYAPSPPWTFTAHAGGVQLTVTDVANSGDIFEVFDFDTPLGTTSLVGEGHFCGLDPAVCVLDSLMSSAVFSLTPGDHSITIRTIASPFGVGAAYFRTDAVPARYTVFLPMAMKNHP